jgi:hypothetical protein
VSKVATTYGKPGATYGSRKSSQRTQSEDLYS